MGVLISKLPDFIDSTRQTFIILKSGDVLRAPIVAFNEDKKCLFLLNKGAETHADLNSTDFSTSLSNNKYFQKVSIEEIADVKRELTCAEAERQLLTLNAIEESEYRKADADATHFNGFIDASVISQVQRKYQTWMQALRKIQDFSAFVQQTGKAAKDIIATC